MTASSTSSISIFHCSLRWRWRWGWGWSRLLLLAIFAFISACGGGSSGGDAGSNVGSPLTISWNSPDTLGNDGNTLVIRSFTVYRGTTADNLVAISSVSVSNTPPNANETAFTDNTVTPGASYFYAISAVTTNGVEGPRSTTISAVAP